MILEAPCPEKNIFERSVAKVLEQRVDENG